MAVLLLFLILYTCKKEDYEQVPYVPVNLRLGKYNELVYLGVGQALTITPDSISPSANSSIIDYHNPKIKPMHTSQRVYGNGIIIYRKDDNEYIAYDRTCTYQPVAKYCAIILDQIPHCPCCNSRFILEAGGYQTTDSKAQHPLRQYNCVMVNNQTEVVISN